MAPVEAGSGCLRTATSEEGGGLGTAGDIQLLKHMGKIVLHGLVAELKGSGNLFIGLPFSNKGQHLLDDVAVDLSFAAVGADRADGAPIRPEFPAPEILLDRGHPADELQGSEVLDTWTCRPRCGFRFIMNAK